MRSKVAVIVIALLGVAGLRALSGALSGNSSFGPSQQAVGTPIKVCVDEAESKFQSALAKSDRSAILSIANEYDIDPRLVQNPARWSDHVSSVTDFCERRRQLERAAHAQEESRK